MYHKYLYFHNNEKKPQTTTTGLGFSCRTGISLPSQSLLTILLEIQFFEVQA